MAFYKYKAKNHLGKTVTGVMEAGSQEELYTMLKLQELYLISSKAEAKASGRKIRARELAEFNRAMGMLLQAGVTLVRGLGILIEEERTKPAQREIYERVLKSVKQGTPLSTAMEEQGASFPPLMIYMYRAAEASGGMDKTAMRLAEHYDKEYRLRAKVNAAMIYPGILCALIVVVIAVLFTVVLPRFEEMFAEMEQLPPLTAFVMGLSDGIKNHWLLIIIIAVIAVTSLMLILRLPPVRLAKDWVKVHLPVLGKLMKVLYSARFSRTLSSLYSAGLPMIAALQISRDTIDNKYIEQQFDEVISKVRAGENLSNAMESVDGIVKKLVSSVMIGEETGNLDAMLVSTADILDYEAEMAIAKMVSFLEPALIIIMAIIVAVVMISVIVPIYGSYGAIEDSAYN